MVSLDIGRIQDSSEKIVLLASSELAGAFHGETCVRLLDAQLAA